MKPKLQFRLAIVVQALALAPRGAVQATPAPDPASLPPDTGIVITRQAVARDPTKSYAVFLPSAYDAARAWPVLVLMDPYGRALVPLELFRGAAGALGYVILSSYDTRVDGPSPFSDSEGAVEDMVNDAAKTLSLDLGRLYLVGFSGTARLAWALGAAAPKYFPAIVGFGGALPTSLWFTLLARGREPPPCFAGAGTGDFGYAEVWHSGEMLAERGVPGAVVQYPGPHDWPQEAVATEAVEWLEILAQRTGIVPTDSAWIRRRFVERWTEARTLERDGRAYDAFLAFRRLTDSFRGFDRIIGPALDSARHALDELTGAGDVRRSDQALRRWLAWEEQSRARIRTIARGLHGSETPSLRSLERELDLHAIQRQVAGRDTLAAQAARRFLALAYANTALHIPRDLLARGGTYPDAAERALRSLELAHRIDPDARGLCTTFASLKPGDRRRSRELADFCRADDDGG